MRKKAIVIGATSGIGRAFAQLLVEKGYIVGITGRRANLLEEMRVTNPRQYIAKQFDIDNYNSVSDSIDQLTALLAGIDLLVLCSGTGWRNVELNLDYEISTVKTNVLGYTAVVNWAYKHFQESGRGSIAAISSITGFRGFALSPSYSSSKSFQMRYLEALRQKAKTSGNLISITDVRAGFVNTAMGQGAGAFWVASPDKAARQILKAINNKKSVAYVTKRWVLIAWLLRLIPSFIYERIKL